MSYKNTEKSFFKHVKKTRTCWIWTSALSTSGYGKTIMGKERSAHRISWKIFNGSIPNGLCVLHKCDIRKCVNPSHLWLGTKKDNSDDMIRKGRSFHPKGQDHGRAILNNKQVCYIRNYAGKNIYKYLMRRFRVSAGTISLIRCRLTWKHI